MGVLRFVRASNASGTLWGTPLTIDGSGGVGFHASLAVVDGNPAVAYRDQGNGILMFIRATNDTGTAWGTPRALDSGGHVGWHPSLAMVNGNPATARGRWAGVTGDLILTVLDTLPDNFGSYAGDGLDDSWQFDYFGPENLLAGALMDPDGDSQDNLFELIAGAPEKFYRVEIVRP